ncbi:hypothetical protein N7532_007192 [Penicillium argentinense]|uniref:Uncharacterized protein n=1 Tax=Penicillium argentinense TaxID=1131581 RepID=A0A9W9F7D4_9EURO|nr:uncharacterized protein N7532_007192 [Penicillium argentinense]KAJ5094901.1 hypothetical protein N7532_007192 [Penicillium argentinense]
MAVKYGVRMARFLQDCIYGDATEELSAISTWLAKLHFTVACVRRATAWSNDSVVHGALTHCQAILDPLHSILETHMDDAAGWPIKDRKALRVLRMQLETHHSKLLVMFATVGSGSYPAVLLPTDQDPVFVRVQTSDITIIRGRVARLLENISSIRRGMAPGLSEHVRTQPHVDIDQALEFAIDTQAIAQSRLLFSLEGQDPCQFSTDSSFFLAHKRGPDLRSVCTSFYEVPGGKLARRINLPLPEKGLNGFLNTFLSPSGELVWYHFITAGSDDVWQLWSCEYDMDSWSVRSTISTVLEEPDILFRRTVPDSPSLMCVFSDNGSRMAICFQTTLYVWTRHRADNGDDAANTQSSWSCTKISLALPLRKSEDTSRAAGTGLLLWKAYLVPDHLRFVGPGGERILVCGADHSDPSQPRIVLRSWDCASSRQLVNEDVEVASYRMILYQFPIWNIPIRYAYLSDTRLILWKLPVMQPASLGVLDVTQRSWTPLDFVEPPPVDKRCPFIASHSSLRLSMDRRLLALMGCIDIVTTKTPKTHKLDFVIDIWDLERRERVRRFKDVCGGVPRLSDDFSTCWVWNEDNRFSGRGYKQGKSVWSLPKYYDSATFDHRHREA